MKIIHHWLKAMVLALVVFVLPVAHAEQNQMMSYVSQWIQEHTKGRVRPSTIEAIVTRVYKEARKHDIDPFLIFSLIKAESTFNTKAASSYGARGLTQVVPRWHRDKIRGRNILDIDTNIEVGTTVLSECLLRHKDIVLKALRCYSGGASPKYAKSINAAHAELKRAQALHYFQAELPLPNSAHFYKPREFFIQPEEYLLAGVN